MSSGGIGTPNKSDNLWLTICPIHKMWWDKEGREIVGVVTDWSRLRSMQGEGTNPWQCLEGQNSEVGQPRESYFSGHIFYSFSFLHTCFSCPLKWTLMYLFMFSSDFVGSYLWVDTIICKWPLYHYQKQKSKHQVFVVIYLHI